MRSTYWLIILGIPLTSCDSKEKGRAYLYDLQISEQTRWHVDGLTPIPDSFATVINVQARYGKLTSYTWSAYGRQKYGHIIKKPAGTLSAQLSDSLYYLTQRIFADIPTTSDSEPQVLSISDVTERKIELSTFNSTVKASITPVGNQQHYTDLMLFIFRHAKH